MKRTAFLLMFMMVTAGFAHAAEGDSTTVTGAVENFYTSLNALFTGDAEPMKAVWSHADDVTYMGPAGGLKKGWSEVAAIWDEQASLKLGGKVTPEQMQITEGQDIALTSNYEVGENVDKDGTLQKVSIRATNIFRKEDGQWKMISHHTDILPYLEKAVGE